MELDGLGKRLVAIYFQYPRSGSNEWNQVIPVQCHRLIAPFSILEADRMNGTI